MITGTWALEFSSGPGTPSQRPPQRMSSAPTGRPRSQRPLAGAEDFSFVLQQVPGAFIMLGACPRGTDPRTAPSNHSAVAAFDDAVLTDGAALYAELALRRTVGQRDESPLIGEGDRLGPVACVNLGEQVIDMALDGAFADDEPFGDLAVRHSCGDQ
jgi:hypothetical protein